jgi:hypothetical protein
MIGLLRKTLAMTFRETLDALGLRAVDSIVG